MAMVTSVAGHFCHGDYAAIEHLAACVLKLDGGVADVKVVLQHMVDLDKDAGALRRGNIGNGHMAGQSAGL